MITAVIFMASFASMKAYADRPPVTTSVRFGNPSSSSCTGKGICNLTDASAISVTFTYINHNTLVLSFSLADLQYYQADQATYFGGSSYIFDDHFSLNISLFSGWGLNDGAWISANSSSSISIVNGIVYDTVSIDYYYL